MVVTTMATGTTDEHWTYSSIDDWRERGKSDASVRGTFLRRWKGGSYGPQFASMENLSDFCENTGVGRVIGSRENWSAKKNLKQLLK